MHGPSAPAPPRLLRTGRGLTICRLSSPLSRRLSLPPAAQIPLKLLAHLSRGRLTDRQTYPDLDLVTTLGLSLLAAPRVDPDRMTPEEALRARRSPEGVEGQFELAVGPIRAVYKVRSLPLGR